RTPGCLRVRTRSTPRDAGARALDRDPAVGRPHGRWEVGFTFKIAVHCRRRSTTFCDGPHDERLAAAGVAGHEHPRLRGLVVAVAGDVATVVERQLELTGEGLLLRPGESEGEQHEVSGDLAL